MTETVAMVDMHDGDEGGGAGGDEGGGAAKGRHARRRQGRRPMDGVTKAEMSDMPMIDMHDGDEGGGAAKGRHARRGRRRRRRQWKVWRRRWRCRWEACATETEALPNDGVTEMEKEALPKESMHDGDEGGGGVRCQ